MKKRYKAHLEEYNVKCHLYEKNAFEQFHLKEKTLHLKQKIQRYQHMPERDDNFQELVGRMGDREVKRVIEENRVMLYKAQQERKSAAEMAEHQMELLEGQIQSHDSKIWENSQLMVSLRGKLASLKQEILGEEN